MPIPAGIWNAADPWDAKENDWENSNFGGTYLKAITE